MRSIVYALMLILGFSTLSYAECVGGTCRTPVRNTVRSVVTAPVIVAKKIASVPLKAYSKRKYNRCR